MYEGTYYQLLCRLLMVCCGNVSRSAGECSCGAVIDEKALNRYKIYSNIPNTAVLLVFQGSDIKKNTQTEYVLYSLLPALFCVHI